MTFYALGIRRSKNDTVLDAFFPIIQSDENQLKNIAEAIQLNNLDQGTYVLSDAQYSACRSFGFESYPSSLEKDANAYSKSEAIFSILPDLQAPIKNTEDAYFRLQLLSQRLVKPHGQNLDGIFGVLANIAWTNIGPILPEDLAAVQAKYFSRSHTVVVTHVDKFPYMVQYHVPSGVRIADAARVRLGAYLGEGTTIMPAGFVNFNAGTLGNAMIEGRISAGVVVAEGSDVGGGASIMGTLSGGNNHVISVGKECLLGANSGIGISLGDGCTVAAGVYVYAGKKVSLFDESNQAVDINGNPVESGKNIVKASDLSGSTFRLFIEDSQTGELICKPNTKVIQLNEALHQNI